jgi:predicted NBD/HSP70 family sugar kinase
MRTHLETKRDGVLIKLMDEQKSSLSLSVIAQAADAGDVEALASFNETGIALGLEIASLVNIFNPEKVILGGPLSVAGKYLLPAIIEGVKQYSLPNINQRTEIVLSAFGPDASVIGAISMVVDYIFSHPSHVVSHAHSTTSRKMISNKDEQDDGASGERTS